MTVLRPLVSIVSCTLLCAFSQWATAAPPWMNMVPQGGKQPASDVKADYTLTKQNGPWLIVAATFRGYDAKPGTQLADAKHKQSSQEARQQAQELVIELRKKYKLAAFTHNRVDDYSERQSGNGIDRYGRPKRMKFLNDDDSLITEVAVLVGDYSAVEDPDCQAALKQIKVMHPDALDVDHGKGSCLITLGVQAAAFGKNDIRHERAPMAKAFVSRNPLLPPETAQNRGVDKMVADMNREVEFSLLKCRGKYTVQVATFTGEVIIDQNKIQQVKSSESAGHSRLAEAAEKAHKVTATLREMGYEAYEFHDRSSSIVTVGGFESTGTPRTDGKIEINPVAFKIIELFKAKDPNARPGQTSLAPTGALQPARVANISMDLQPMMVEVPRRSISADYSTARD